MYLLPMHVGTKDIFTLIKSYYNNIDRGGGNVETYTCSIHYIYNFFNRRRW
jgi:hypothetical protein